MEVREISKGSIISYEGDPMSKITIVVKGHVEAKFGNRLFRYENGDALGICDFVLGIYSSDYTAVTDVTLVSYPYKNLSALDALFKELPEVAYSIVCSMCKHIFELLQYKTHLKDEAERAFETAHHIYSRYEELCKRLQLPVATIREMSEIVPFSGVDLIDDWVYAFYVDVKNVNQHAHKDFFNNSPGLKLGFIRRAAEDAVSILHVCRDYINYLAELSQVYLYREGHDLLSLVSTLHLAAIDSADAEALMHELTALLSGMTGINSARLQSRVTAYNENLNDLRLKAQQLALEKKQKEEQARAEEELRNADAVAKSTTIPIVDSVTASQHAAKPLINAQGKVEVTKEIYTPILSDTERQELDDSMSIILIYSACPVEVCQKFTQLVNDFEMLEDKRSYDDSRGLRRELISSFYKLYKAVLIRSLSDSNVPTVVKMFLNFGYVNTSLAGYENAEKLYKIADTYKGNPEFGIYTLVEWMGAIYRGEKEPSRSEFDIDYTTYVKELKKGGTIDASEEKSMLADNEKKLLYELENAFPSVNKITSGAVSLFCPIFSEHSVVRPIDMALVRTEALKSAFDDVLEVDFSAFYRPTAYVDQSLGVNSFIHIEVLPDLILLPNIGTRGMLWQEIVHRDRSTASRMFLPAFLQTDLKKLVIKLCGEFRWEMCKRIHGTRWSDVTDPSLTSEYVDYLQFYAKNKDLTIETRTQVKSELSKARNNYRSVFVANYAEWLLYESNGMQRLNRVASSIMYTYCPFPAEVREKLKLTIPRFAAISKRLDIKLHKRTKFLTNLIQKITQNRKKVPPEIINELDFTKR